MEPTTITVWFCTLCREDVRVGAQPDACPNCGHGLDLTPIQVAYERIFGMNDSDLLAAIRQAVRETQAETDDLWTPPVSAAVNVDQEDVLLRFFERVKTILQA